ncbi:hypothetical protein CHARACLAT_020801, partial [Characodon lateralis]|nr:hypothetical protein [Characodon lateralis]
AKVRLNLLNLKSKQGSYKKFQAQQTEKTIRDEFQKLYQFLRAEEAGRIDACRKEAKRKSDAMNVRIVNLTAGISEFMKKIKTIEDEMRTDDISFMQNVKKTLKRSSCTQP